MTKLSLSDVKKMNKTKALPLIDYAKQLNEQLFNTTPNELPSIDPLNLPPAILERLFDHQRDGVAWMYGLYLAKQGGILGNFILVTLRKYK